MKVPFVVSLITVLFLLPKVSSAQEIFTGEEYFDSISEIYGDIEDYQADIIITQDETVMEGVLYYKQPNLLRINFSVPEEQVLVVDEEALTIYIPEHSVIMHQPLKKRSTSTITNMASEQGLLLLKRNYSVAYLIGPDPIPLDEPALDETGAMPAQELVVKMKLDWRSTDEGFRQLEISIGENGLIRRINGVTVGYENIQFDLTNILVNQNIPEARFDYESPATANIFENFLFEPEE